jgi:leader peptidase (prepilin peptidase)/N-methyltransferase
LEKAMSMTASAVLSATFGCVLVVIVLAMAIIDIQKMILPDVLNLALGTVGLAHSIVVGRPDPVDAVIGALIGAGFLWSVAVFFRYLRGFDGLGLGDQKFVAAAGLWIGWQGLAPMLLVSSVSALIFALLRMGRTRSLESTARLPFGPFLGLGICVAWFSAQVG